MRHVVLPFSVEDDLAMRTPARRYARRLSSNACHIFTKPLCTIYPAEGHTLKEQQLLHPVHCLLHWMFLLDLHVLPFWHHDLPYPSHALCSQGMSMHFARIQLVHTVHNLAIMWLHKEQLCTNGLPISTFCMCLLYLKMKMLSSASLMY